MAWAGDGMSELVRRIRRDVPASCQAKKCAKKGCSLSLKGVGKNRVIIDVDCKELDLPKDGSRCDFVYVGCRGKQDWLAVIELKGGAVEARDVWKQAQACASYAERVLLERDEKVQFQPVVAYAGKVHGSQVSALRKKLFQVKFRGDSYGIKLLRCGKQLTDALV